MPEAVAAPPAAWDVFDSEKVHTRRKFLELFAAACALGLSPRSAKGIPAKRWYVTKVTWDDLVGLRFTYTKVFRKPNPAPFHDWEIFERCPSPFKFKDQWIDNFWCNKFMVRPVGKTGPTECLVFAAMKGEYGLVDLSREEFWRV